MNAEGKKINILFIDDDKATNFINKHIAKKNDNIRSIGLLYSGFEGIDYIKECLYSGHGLPNIIFLDINMPAMNGWEFLEAFYALDETLVDKIEVIILSSSNDPKDLNRFKGFEQLLDFLTKPLNEASFNATLKKVENNDNH